MLGLRIGLALAFQLLFAAAFSVLGNSSPWRSAADWWLASLALAEIVNLWVLTWAARKEGIRLRDLYNIRGEGRRDDLKWLALGLLGAAPLALIPGVLLANALFVDAEVAQNLTFRAIPVWAAWSV
ncbi:MAG: hypothetical protein WAL25_02090, partial [Acidimicrobiia bacterium]